MAGMRDVLIHGYMGVDVTIVWDVVANRLRPVPDESSRGFFPSVDAQVDVRKAPS
jgi:uncharacterized protein with HEPN domain